MGVSPPTRCCQRAMSEHSCSDPDSTYASLDPGWQELKWFLDIDNRPLKSLGIVAGVIGAVIFSLNKLAVG